MRGSHRRVGRRPALYASVALAAGALAGCASSGPGEGAVTEAEIADFYNRHPALFQAPERRYFDIVNRAGLASAMRAKREVEAGRSFARMALHEYLDHSDKTDPAEKGAITRAIFAARLHVISEPVKLYNGQSLFEVTRIVPAVESPLAQVRPAIRKRLVAERQQK